MVREIKFRAWQKDYKIMHDDMEFSSHDGKGIGLNEFINGVLPKLNNYTLMQYTGLKDKNGKEIYEGDIVKPINPPSTKKYNREVAFVDGAFSYKDMKSKNGYWRLDQGLCMLFKVIGNIYENPELLNN